MKRAGFNREGAKARRGFPVSAFCFLLSALVFCGCYGTVTPKPVVTTQASWDGQDETSGLLCFVEDGKGKVAGAIITGHAKDRYDALMVEYGARWQPAVKPGDGVVPRADGTWLIDAQHFAYFAIANQWRKATANQH